MRRLPALLSLLLLATGCDSPYAVTPIVTSAADVPGTYVLRTIDGAPLPYTYQQVGTDTYEVLDDQFTLTADGGWTETWHERHTVSGVVTTPAYSDEGTFTYGGATIVFTSTVIGTGQPYFQGTVSEGALNLPGQGAPGGPIEAMVYTK